MIQEIQQHQYTRIIKISVFKTLCMICHNDTQIKNRKTTVTSNKRSKILLCDDSCRLKMILLFERRHDDEKLYAYIFSLKYSLEN